MVKYGEALKFNGLPEWKAHYIQYDRLKDLIYDQEERLRLHRLQAAEKLPPLDEEAVAEPFLDQSRSPLLRSGSMRRSLSLRPEGEDGRHGLSRSTSGVPDPEEGREQFKQLFMSELCGVAAFYDQKEREVLAQVSLVTEKIRSAEMPVRETVLGHTSPGLQSPEQAGMADLTTQRRIRMWSKADMAERRERLRQQLTNAFVEVDNLKQFLHENAEGFRKAAKKWDKVNDDMLRPLLMDQVADKLQVQQNQRALEAIQQEVVDAFSVVVCKGNSARADGELRKLVKMQLSFERDTVWRDMATLERRRANVRIKQPGEAQPATAWQRFYKQYRPWLALTFSLAVFGAIMGYPIFPHQPEKQNCLAMLVLVSLLWCTEALPLYITALLVPLLAVGLRVLVVEEGKHHHRRRLDADEGAPQIFAAMFSQVIMLLLGGFAIAAALTKHLIAKATATAILSRVNRAPRWVLAAFMGVASFASMWVSNVAAPVLCFSLLEPLLRVYHPGSPVSKALIMGVALASNLGGMTSPISSPQNIFAIERMSIGGGGGPSWLQWFAVAIPIVVVGNVLCWGLLCLRYRPGRAVREVEPLKAFTDPWNRTQIFVMAVSLLTVGLWCGNHALQRWTGDMGVIAIFPLVLFFGTGVLSKDDFKSFPWDVVLLAMGGLALGEAVKSSGLLLTVAKAIGELVSGLGLWQVLAVFCAVVLVCTTFISHTVGAIVILPVVQSVGASIGDHPHPKLLVMGAALMCSGAMGLPVSGFPNMAAASLDSLGQPYVTTADFLQTGVPGSILTYGVIISLGYVLMLWVGF